MEDETYCVRKRKIFVLKTSNLLQRNSNEFLVLKKWQAELERVRNLFYRGCSMMIGKE